MLASPPCIALRDTPAPPDAAQFACSPTRKNPEENRWQPEPRLLLIKPQAHQRQWLLHLHLAHPALGRSQGKPCRCLISWNARKQRAPQSGASSGRAGRTESAAAASTGFIAVDLPMREPSIIPDFPRVRASFTRSPREFRQSNIPSRQDKLPAPGKHRLCL